LLGTVKLRNLIKCCIVVDCMYLLLSVSVPRCVDS
jgi:hypothetical protein